MAEGKLQAACLSVAAVLIKGTSDSRKKKEKNTTKRKQRRCESEALSASYFPGRHACPSHVKFPIMSPKSDSGRGQEGDLFHTWRKLGGNVCVQRLDCTDPFKRGAQEEHTSVILLFFHFRIYFSHLQNPAQSTFISFSLFFCIPISRM